MNPFLEWGILNSNPEELKKSLENPEQIDLSKVDPDLLEYIVHGDVVEIKNAIKTLNESDDSEQLIHALEVLEFHMESMDHANNLAKLNGLQPVLDKMKHQDPEVAIMAVWVLGTCAQNNPEFQKVLFQHNGLLLLVQLLKESKNDKLKSKLIYALSGSVRDNPEGFEQFHENGGMDSCIEILKLSNDEGLKKKTAFMINHLGRDYPNVRDAISNEDLIHVLSQQLELEKNALYK